MTRRYFQTFAVTIAFIGGALATALVLAIPAVQASLGLSAWAQDGYEGGLAILAIASASGLGVDLLRLISGWLANIGQNRDATSKT